MAGMGGVRRRWAHGRGLGRVLLAAAIMLGLLGGWPAPAGAWQAGRLYEDGWWRGRSFTVEMPPAGVPRNLDDWQANQVSAIEVWPGVTITLFSDRDGEGICEEFTHDDADLRNNVIGDDNAESYMVGWGCPARLFEHSGYRGAKRFVTADIPDLRALGFNDTATSLRVPHGGYIAAYSGINYGGTCQTMWADQPDLRLMRIGHDTISSVRYLKYCPQNGPR